MKYNQLILLLLISLPSFIFRSSNGSQKITLTNLTRFQIEGVVARFVVDREALEQVLQNRKVEDGVCGQDVNLQLSKALPPATYNASRESEIDLFHGRITDFTLTNELTNDLKEQVATTYRFLAVMMPVIIGKTATHGVLQLRTFTDSTKTIIHPYSTSIKGVTQVDSMEEEDGIVRLRIGDDVMAYTTQDKANCQGEKNVGKDFDTVTGKVLTFTSYPLPFDWYCSFIGSQISFCKALEEVQCELAGVGGDVCVRISTGSSKRVPTSMKVVNMTGIFRDMFPYLAGSIPSESFEAELIDREHTSGITFPCLTS